MVASATKSGMLIVPIVAKTFQEAKEQIAAAQGDAVELRLDALDAITPDEIRDLTAMAKVLVTDRRKPEGGLRPQTDTQRFDALHAAIEAKPWAVDLEWQSPRMFRRKLIQLAREHGVRVISSYHNFTRTPEAQKLEQIVQECLAESDYAKIVSVPEGERDITALLGLVRKHPGKVAAFGMGEKATHTRVLSLKLGAPFGFCKGVHATAPGQLTADEMRKQLTENTKKKQGNEGMKE